MVPNLGTWLPESLVFAFMPLRTVEHLLEERQLTLAELAASAKLEFERVAAIAEGRWLPSPFERERIAEAFNVAVAEVSWGHTMNPRNIRYHRFGLKEDIGGQNAACKENSP